ncbi:MAG: hypothetical protein KAX55_00650 [Propionivibrio sp.]|nr:hypothetical protein [Propionivibrio sp.]
MVTMEVNWEEVARNLAGALDCCVTQIEQMKGLFPDDDGNIAEALQEAEEAERMLARAHEAAKVPVIDIEKLEWESLQKAISECPRWIEGGKHGLAMNGILWEIHHWIKAGAPLPPDPVDASRVEAIAEKIRDAGDENVLDEMVHDAFSDQASAVNNSGLSAQIRYLLENDFGEQEILDNAGIQSGISCGR